MTKNIFRTKSINEFISETKHDGGMNKVLGTFGLTMLGIGCIVGTGIFVLTGRRSSKLFRTCAYYFFYYCCYSLWLCRIMLF
jgi:amino acid permease